ncbi:MAG: helix-turn-helix domain-containing protein [Providencia sp.]|jgi:transcriptional regulator with XRE-family HTH domain|nr:helix-turn-helix domain-containing protein [Providencia sp.]
MSINKDFFNDQLENHDNFFSKFCGAVIKKLRKEVGVTGAELAMKLNISQRQMSRYERGINKFSVDMLFKTSIVLNVPFERLIKYILSEMEESNSDDVAMLKKTISASDTIYFY